MLQSTLVGKSSQSIAYRFGQTCSPSASDALLCSDWLIETEFFRWKGGGSSFRARIHQGNKVSNAPRWGGSRDAKGSFGSIEASGSGEKYLCTFAFVVFATMNSSWHLENGVRSTVNDWSFRIGHRLRLARQSRLGHEIMQCYRRTISEVNRARPADCIAPQLCLTSTYTWTIQRDSPFYSSYSTFPFSIYFTAITYPPTSPNHTPTTSQCKVLSNSLTKPAPALRFVPFLSRFRFAILPLAFDIIAHTCTLFST